MFAKSSEFGAGPSASRGKRVAPPARLRVPVGAFGVELVRGVDLDAIAEPWRRLARAAIEPNPFAEHAVLASAARHLREARRLEALCVWREETLVGLVPLERVGLRGARLVPFRTPLVPCATPLVDRQEPEAILAAAFGFARARGFALVLGDIPADGPLASAARAAGLAPHALPGREGAGEAPAAAPAKATGLSIARTRAPAAMRDAVERLLTLDAETAPAQSRTAIVQDVGAASLVRAATRRAAQERACRVHIATRDGVPVAAAAILRDTPWLRVARPGEEAALAALLADLPAAPAAPLRLSDFAPASPRPRGRIGERLGVAGDLLGAVRRLVGADEARTA